MPDVKKINHIPIENATSHKIDNYILQANQHVVLHTNDTQSIFPWTLEDYGTIQNCLRVGDRYKEQCDTRHSLIHPLYLKDSCGWRYEEILSVKKKLLTSDDTVVLKQATSKVVYRISQEQYFMQFVLVVPEEYPIKQVKIELEDHNFPEILKVNFISQATEIARKCVQPPIKKKPKDPPFEPQPSVLPVVKFLVESVKKFPVMCCPLCKERVLPQNPSEPVTDKRRRMEKLYCGHLFHFICLYKYIKTPPFTGKICPDCGNAIYHDKFKLSPQLMEARWAHKQARQRELDEVVDFLE
ncbi:Hypothetical predicted protein [Mytilus galloprovincialis]|uniref:RING-type domain-containing protein n=1 Tax=Mytilus galloprovincialis TaxID=29158 RepID=A0A8B6FPU8_MYTGA|nr:Hypothetical predicted protein [Mytilus galloprovincialis]